MTVSFKNIEKGFTIRHQHKTVTEDSINAFNQGLNDVFYTVMNKLDNKIDYHVISTYSEDSKNAKTSTRYYRSK